MASEFTSKGSSEKQGIVATRADNPRKRKRMHSLLGRLLRRVSEVIFQIRVSALGSAGVKGIRRVGVVCFREGNCARAVSVNADVVILERLIDEFTGLCARTCVHPVLMKLAARVSGCLEDPGFRFHKMQLAFASPDRSITQIGCAETSAAYRDRRTPGLWRVPGAPLVARQGLPGPKPGCYQSNR